MKGREVWENEPVKQTEYSREYTVGHTCQLSIVFSGFQAVFEVHLLFLSTYFCMSLTKKTTSAILTVHLVQLVSLFDRWAMLPDYIEEWHRLFKLKWQPNSRSPQGGKKRLEQWLCECCQLSIIVISIFVIDCICASFQISTSQHLCNWWKSVIMCVVLNLGLFQHKYLFIYFYIVQA